jgi:type I restriction-modification system DNA methylase subunit
MNQSTHNKLVSFIWRIADDCLRDVYVRGKYRDVILPMVVLRRLDTLLEPTKEAVLEEIRFQKEEMGATELDEEPLREASGYVFYNTSQWTLKRLHGTATNKVTDETHKTDKALSIKESQITALKKYKATLINAAVTGKIKVTSDRLDTRDAVCDHLLFQKAY